MVDFDKELAFLKLAENLKKELRHSWLSDGRQESVAEHCWRLALMVYRYAHQLDKEVNVGKCMVMAIIHDFAEAVTGDIPVFYTNTQQEKVEKYQSELIVMENIKKKLGDEQGEVFFNAWQEYELQSCYESKFVRALDKLEAFIQHNEAPLSTWEGTRERYMIFQDRWLHAHCRFDSFLSAFATSVLAASKQKLIDAGEDVVLLEAEALAEEKC